MKATYQTLLKFRCSVSKTRAELKSETRVVLNGFDKLPMTQQQLDAAIEMLKAVSEKMQPATGEEQEADEEEDDDDEDDDEDDAARKR